MAIDAGKHFMKAKATLKKKKSTFGHKSKEMEKDKKGPSGMSKFAETLAKLRK